MLNDDVVLATRECSSMVSTWTEYLVFRCRSGKMPLLEICMYEALADCMEFYDEEADEIALPDYIDGKVVIGIDDEYIVGGDLLAVDYVPPLSISGTSVESILEWATALHFPLALADLRRAGLGDL